MIRLASLALLFALAACGPPSGRPGESTTPTEEVAEAPTACERVYDQMRTVAMSTPAADTEAVDAESDEAADDETAEDGAQAEAGEADEEEAEAVAPPDADWLPERERFLAVCGDLPADLQDCLVRRMEGEEEEAHDARCRQAFENADREVLEQFDENMAEAFAYYELHRNARRCEEDDATACLEVARMLGGVDAQQGQGINVGVSLAHACELGAMEGCVLLGIMLDEGRAIEQNRPRAVEFVSMACDEQAAAGCLYLGHMYRQGHGVDQDYDEAYGLYQQVCDDGELSGCYAMAAMISEGQGREADPAQAAEIYGSACELGHLDSCINLGGLYLEGRGVEHDEERTFNLWSRACEEGHPDACANVAGLYLEGRGVAQDRERAERLFIEACRGGSRMACQTLEQAVERARQEGAGAGAEGAEGGEAAAGGAAAGAEPTPAE